MPDSLRNRFISPTGGLMPGCESGQIVQIMVFAQRIDLEELGDCDGDYRYGKYKSLYPTPEKLKELQNQWQEYADADGRIAVMHDGSERDNEKSLYIQERGVAIEEFDLYIKEQHPTAISWETLGDIEDLLNKQAVQDRLEEFMDEFPDGPPDFDFGFELVFEEEYSPARILKTLFADEKLMKKLKEQKPEAWADLMEKVSLHALTVPYQPCAQAPEAG